MSNEVRAAGFVIFRRICNRIEYLLMQASYGDHHWTPPKGHAEAGESDMETALRETEEEAGLKRKDLKIIEDCKTVIKYVVKGRPKVVVYWLAEVLNNAPVVVSHEHQAYEWVSIDKACELAKYKEMQNVLRDCDEYIHANK